MENDKLILVRSRAYDLADTGRFKHWNQIASALEREGVLLSLIETLGADKLAVMMITRSCDQARARH
ncbi:MAG: hypothetical protein ABW199_00045 [Caulobacterales bacterium]